MIKNAFTKDTALFISHHTTYRHRLMCGIAGIISAPGNEAMPAKLGLMANALQHRGPDGEGFWQNESANLGFAHRRLAIIDKSTAASQPLHYLHYTIVFNGEIYNYTGLKTQLAQHGYVFTTQGDTEVLPAAYDFWGEAFLNHLDGMFAFALFDHKSQRLLIARDRFGEKPLYYYQENGAAASIFFASEIKGLWAAGVPKQANNGMLLNYLSLGYVQNPVEKSQTFYKQIFSLSPGHLLTLCINEKKIAVKKWYFPEKAIAQLKKPTDEGAAVEQFTALLQQSVARRLRSDVPVGTSLSGGLDSSAIVASIHQLLQTMAVPSEWSNLCFTAIFPGFAKDEAGYASLVANSYGLRQYTVQPDAANLISQWQTLVYHQEEPFQSSSVFTQYKVYELAKEHGITVLLDGQGADEVLGGYKKYTQWYLQQLARSRPSLFAKEKKWLIENDLLENWGIKNLVASYFPKQAAGLLAKKALSQQSNHPFLNSGFLEAHQQKDSLDKPVVNSLEDILAYNTFQFGLEELLRYADRNSMAHGREVRLPFLSHQLVEFVFSLPSHYKIRGGFTKWILRQSMASQLPPEIVWRKGKVGFEPPQQQWMQQPALQEMVMQGRQTLVSNGILEPAIMNQPVQSKAAHEGDNHDWRYLSAAAILGK